MNTSKLFALIFFFYTSINISQTNVSGSISTNTTWNLTGSPYIVTGSIIVDQGIALTIESGVSVKFNNGLALRVDGTLIARGTNSTRIIFTSNSNTPSPGSWAYIIFTNSSSDATYDQGGNYTGGCILEYCNVLYGGSISGSGVIYVQESSPYVKSCNISNNNNAGIQAVKSRIKIDNNIISNNNGKGIFFNNENFQSPPVRNILIKNNTITNNTEDGIRLYHIYSDTAIIQNNVISGNHGEGGIVNGSYIAWEDGSLWFKIIGNTIQNNSGTRAGGITCFRPRFAEISSNNIIQNTGNDVGGIYVHADFDISKLIMNNNIITNNTAQKYSACYITFFASSLNSTSIISGNNISSNITTLTNYSAVGFEGDMNYNVVSFNITNNVIRKNTGSRTITLRNCKGFLNQNNLDSNNTIYDIYSENTATAPSFNARRNYWGTTNINVINNRVYDFFDDPSRGVVLVDSFAINPYPIGIIKETEIIPKSYLLSQNYPNPFNPNTCIEFDIPKKSIVTLKVYDILGREITLLLNESLNSGSYKFVLNASNLSSGVYYYRITAGDFTDVKKMVVVK